MSDGFPSSELMVSGIWTLWIIAVAPMVILKYSIC
jgi:hypothetical protein